MIGLLSEETAPASALSLSMSALSTLARKHCVIGAQVAIHHDGATIAGEIGELEVNTGRRVTRGAAFPVGSMTKYVTATVAMILVADGDVDPDAPIADYVAELGDLGAVINLRQLLSHTSGLLAEVPGAEGASTLTLRRYVTDKIGRNNLVLQPGVGFSYSNPGYGLAGRLIETVTGMSWAEAVESILRAAPGGSSCHGLLVECNDSAREVARVRLAELFEAQVRRTPKLPAIVCGGDAVSFADVEARANRLAHALIWWGAGPERGSPSPRPGGRARLPSSIDPARTHSLVCPSASHAVTSRTSARPSLESMGAPWQVPGCRRPAVAVRVGVLCSAEEGDADDV